MWIRKVHEWQELLNRTIKDVPKPMMADAREGMTVWTTQEMPNLGI